MDIEVKSRVKAHEALISCFPGIPEKYDDEFNKLFINFIFSKNHGQTKECICTSCYGRFEIPARINDSELIHARHGDVVRCPLCGKPLEYKVVGRSGGMHSLNQMRRALIIIPTDDQNLVFGALVLCSKNYKPDSYHERRIDKSIEAIYAWTPGEACAWTKKWRYDNGGWKWRYEEAVSPSAGKATLYFTYLIGAEWLKNTFLRYCALEVLIENDATHNFSGSAAARWLAEYCVHPGIEMLAKAGHFEIIEETLFKSKRGDGCLDWSADRLWKFYRMDKQEYNRFIQKEPTLERLEWRRTLEHCYGNSDIVDADEEIERYGHSDSDRFCYRRVAGVVRDISRKKFANYIDRQCNEKTPSMRRYVLHIFYDYVTMAHDIGYDLNEPNVRLPKDLKAAHDTAAGIQRVILREREAKRRKEAEIAYESRRAELERIYSYADDIYLIRVPESASEIVSEGEALRHCVGGYAERHITGKVTILFVRKIERPDESFFTVEMGVGESKWELKQIHGSHNCLPDKRLNKFIAGWIKAGGKKENTHHESKAS